jgi:hypothetical protein
MKHSRYIDTLPGQQLSPELLLVAFQASCLEVGDCDMV